jgi:hypothetical protein
MSLRRKFGILSNDAITCLFVLFLAAVFVPAQNSKGHDPVDSETDIPQQAKGRHLVEDWELDKLSAKAAYGGSDLTNCEAVIAYYDSQDSVSIKAKLPISVCLAGYHRLEESRKLASEYVNVYSNDWRGWHILGISCAGQSSWNAAISALTNAIKLGGTNDYAVLAMICCSHERTEVVREFVPQMLAIKRSCKTGDSYRLELIKTLIYYSSKIGDEELFVKTLEGVSASEVASESDLPCIVTTVCGMFTNKAAVDICKALQKQSDAKINQKSR